MAAPRRPNANTEDKATQWLNQNSAGAGAVHAGRLDPQRADPADAQPALLARAGAFRACGGAPHGRQRDAVAGDQARRHRCGVQSDPRADRDAEGRHGCACRGAGEPRFRLHGADQRAGLQQGAGREGGAPGGLLRDRLRRDHQQPAGRHRRCAAPASFRSDCMARRARRRSSSASIRISIERSSCCRRPASRMGSNSS